MKLRCRDRVLSLERAAIVGVLNVTPDSFSDGGLWAEPRAAVEHGLEMVAQGADVLDVGGESTRPDAEPVPLDEERARVLPVVEELGRRVEVPISIDTRKEPIATEAVAAGAAIVNDTTGEATDRSLDAVAAHTGAALILMHSRGTPSSMRSLTQYTDVVDDVAAWLRARADMARAAGVAPESIVVDPGFGFAKTAQQNLELLCGLERVTALGYPVLVGTSRKSFIGAVLDLPVERRLEGTAATVAWAVAKGARLVRVHDVPQLARVVRMTEAISGATQAR